MFNFNKKGIKLLVYCFNNFYWNRSSPVKFKSPTIQVLNNKFKTSCIPKWQGEMIKINTKNIGLRTSLISTHHSASWEKSQKKSILPWFIPVFLHYEVVSRRASIMRPLGQKSYSENVLMLVIVLPQRRRPLSFHIIRPYFPNDPITMLIIYSYGDTFCVSGSDSKYFRFWEAKSKIWI